MSIHDDVLEAIGRIPLEFEKIRTELSEGVQQYANAVRLRGARAVPVGPAGRPLVWAGPGRLVGWSVHATGGAVTVVLRDGRDGSGDAIAAIELTAGASSTTPAPGVSFTEGLFAVVTGAGTLEGSVWLGAVD